jgi:tetratricopeptide (TPR) repeat protein
MVPTRSNSARDCAARLSQQPGMEDGLPLAGSDRTRIPRTGLNPELVLENQADRMPKSTPSPKTLAAKVRPFTNTAQKEALSAYSGAVAAMQTGRFEKALEGFRSLEGNCPPEIGERARMYTLACERNLKKYEPLAFETAAEQFDYAISRMNHGDYEDAREHLEAVLEREETADYAHYGLAVLHSMTNQAEGSLHHLERAIELNPYNRTQARSDTDFRQMADDPRFTELLYPEAI